MANFNFPFGSGMQKDTEKEYTDRSGMTTTEMQKLLKDNKGLAAALQQSFGASLMPDQPMQYGQSVGPLNGYVSNPFGALAQGVGQGLKVGMQARGQRALLDALRGQGGGADLGPETMMQAGRESTADMSAFNPQTPPPMGGPPQGMVPPPPMPPSGDPGAQPGGWGGMGQNAVSSPAQPPPAAAPATPIPGIPATPMPGQPPPLPGETQAQYRMRLQGMNQPDMGPMP